MKKHYLVTGGAGFIGSHLVEALLKLGCSVTVLDDLSTGKKENLFPDAEFIEGSIVNADLVSKLLNKVEGCFHLAAIPSVAKSIENWAQTHHVNQGGSVNIFAAAADLDCPVVFASSAAVYGDCDILPLKETGPARPLSPYGLDKLGCEMQAHMGALCKGLHSAGLRFFNVYGPRQDPKSPYSGVISIFMDKIRQGQPLTVFGDGLQDRDFIYVKDVVATLLASMHLLHDGQTSYEIFNVATEKRTNINKLASIIMEIGGIKVPLNHMSARSGDIRFSCGSNQKAREMLGIKDYISIEEGLAATWEALA